MTTPDASQESGLPEAKEWVLKNGRRVHPAFSVAARYDDQRAQAAPHKAQNVDPLQLHTDNFVRAMAIYRSSAKDKSLKDFDVGFTHTWDDVIREYERAQKLYLDKSKGLRGLPRKLGRLAGDNSASMNPFLKFIPEGDYTSIISAGLFLIFGAAGRMSERRVVIFEAFGDIPSTIQDAERDYEDFAQDSLIEDEMVELYLAVLIAIMEMMQWLVEKSGWKQIKAILQGPRYAASLDDKIKDVKKRSLSLRTRIERLTRNKIVTTASTTERTEVEVQAIKSSTITIETDTTATRADMAEVKQSLKAMDSLTSLLKEQTKQADWRDEFREEARKRQEVERKLQVLQQRNAELESMEACRQHQGMIATTQDLLDALNVDLDEIQRDVAIVMRKGQGSDQSISSRCHLLMRNAQFKKWLTSDISGCLLIDGQGPSGSERISAMTIVSALLAQDLPKETANVIQFMCGLHTNEYESVSGPRGLLRALLSQLMAQYQPQLSFRYSSEFTELQRADPHRLCALIAASVKQLPEGTVLFCIIDGISLYENDDWTQETCFALQNLINLAYDPEVKATFKILITSPLASHYVSQYVPQEDRLSLPRNREEDDGEPLSRRQLALQGRTATDEGYQEDFYDDENDEGFGQGDFNEGNFE